jgi:hypothetical protein
VRQRLATGRYEAHGAQSGIMNAAIVTVEQLQGFSFMRLQRKFFQFKLPRFTVPSASATPSRRAIVSHHEMLRSRIFLKTEVMGLVAFSTAHAQRIEALRADMTRWFRREGRAMKSPRRIKGVTGDLIAYEEMSKAVTAALSNLSQREARAMHRRASVS